MYSIRVSIRAESRKGILLLWVETRKFWWTAGGLVDILLEMHLRGEGAGWGSMHGMDTGGFGLREFG